MSLREREKCNAVLCRRKTADSAKKLAAACMTSKKRMAFLSNMRHNYRQNRINDFFLLSHQSILLLPFQFLHGDRLLLFDPPHKIRYFEFSKIWETERSPSSPSRYNRGGGVREGGGSDSRQTCPREKEEGGLERNRFGNSPRFWRKLSFFIVSLLEGKLLSFFWKYFFFGFGRQVEEQKKRPLFPAERPP